MKTGQAFHVDLSPDVLMLLRRYHDDLGVIPTPESVAVRTRRGKPFKKERLSRDVRIILRAAGVPDTIQMRDLRRTAATEMAEAGATESELSVALGLSHRTSAVMLDTYAPGNSTMAQNAREKRKGNKKR